MDIEELDQKIEKLQHKYFIFLKKMFKKILKFIPQLIIFSFLGFLYYGIYQSKGFEISLIACLISIIFLLGRILGNRC